jgi:transmembrane sensor
VADLSEDNSVEWEAAQWVARRMGNDAFDEEAFDAWLAAHPQRKPLFDTMWQRVMGPGMDNALSAYGRRGRPRRAAMAGGAAALAALVGGYAGWPSLELMRAQPQHYAAAEGSLRDVTLADGTRLTLAGGADIRVRYTSHDRIVELRRGTLFADVTHDERRPFRIDAGNARITDLGTRFEVSTKPANVRVTVESGEVRLGSSAWFGARMDLSADQAAMLDQTDLHRIDNAGAGGVARWRREWVEYRDAPLTRVIADLESVSPLPIRIGDRTLAALRVSGRIRLTDPVRQLDNLSVIHTFAVTRRDGTLLLTQGPPRP